MPLQTIHEYSEDRLEQIRIHVRILVFIVAIGIKRIFACAVIPFGS